MSAGNDDNENAGRREEGAERVVTGTSPVEWAVAALGAAILAGVIGYLAHDGLTGSGAPPDLSVRVVSTLPAKAGHHVQVLVLNDGQSPAAAVDVVGELRDGETVVEEASTTVDYLPQNSEKPAGLMFTEDPAAFRLVVRAAGYTAP
ncbi:hypothetical protein [Mongoliimonas terrestris]|uniref:hypothetical protein n=1 Tax=Mongoliimonas terrestris TaxID=1709001 RepID=UPI0009FAD53D|nr:hypothetical protein [Mongoliimonas terrestris]